MGTRCRGRARLELELSVPIKAGVGEFTEIGFTCTPPGGSGRASLERMLSRRGRARPGRPARAGPGGVLLVSSTSRAPLPHPPTLLPAPLPPPPSGA